MGRFAQLLHVGVRGSLRVELERDAPRPSDVLIGAVYLTVTKPIDSASLKVRIHGRQMLSWKYWVGTTKVDDSRKLELLAEEAHYPFSLRLPADLHHSFIYTNKKIQDLEELVANAAFFVDVELDTRAFRSSNLHACVPFTVEPVPSPRTPLVIVHSGNVKLLSVVKRGACDLSVAIVGDVFDKSSTIEADVTLQLEPTHRLKYILLALYEDVTVNRHVQIYRIKHGTRLVRCRRFDHTATAAKDSIGGSIRRRLLLPITPSDIYELQPLQPTLRAHYVDIRYRVAVECHFSLSGTLSVDTPVTIT